MTKLTGRVVRLKHPVGVFGISDSASMPFKLQVPGKLLELGWARKSARVKMRFRRHGKMSVYELVSSQRGPIVWLDDKCKLWQS